MAVRIVWPIASKKKRIVWPMYISPHVFLNPHVLRLKTCMWAYVSNRKGISELKIDWKTQANKKQQKRSTYSIDAYLFTLKYPDIPLRQGLNPFPPTLHVEINRSP